MQWCGRTCLLVFHTFTLSPLAGFEKGEAERERAQGRVWSSPHLCLSMGISERFCLCRAPSRSHPPGTPFPLPRGEIVRHLGRFAGRYGLWILFRLHSGLLQRLACYPMIVLVRAAQVVVGDSWWWDIKIVGNSRTWNTTPVT